MYAHTYMCSIYSICMYCTWSCACMNRHAICTLCAQITHTNTHTHLNDVSILNHCSKQLFIFRIILLLFQISCMLQKREGGKRDELETITITTINITTDSQSQRYAWTTVDLDWPQVGGVAPSSRQDVTTTLVEFAANKPESLNRRARKVWLASPW